MRERQSNIELLRILAMVLIVLHHIGVHGGWWGAFIPEGNTANTSFILSLSPLGRIGVDIFVLISGYFLASSKKSTWPKVLKIWFAMLFYSVFFSALFILSDGESLTRREILTLFTPTLSSTWWFATCYVLLLAISPFINKILDRCNEIDMLKLILGMLIIWMIIPSLMNLYVQFESLTWFIVVYIIGAYVARYPHHFNHKARNYLVCALLIYLLDVALICEVAFNGYSSFFWRTNYIVQLTSMYSILCFPVAMFLFLGFRKIEIPHNRIINAVAATTFGIYLIHEQPYVRTYIYTEFFDCSAWFETAYVVPYVLAICAVIFIVCSVEDFIRRNTLERYVVDPLSKIAERIQQRLDAFLDSWLTR